MTTHRVRLFGIAVVLLLLSAIPAFAANNIRMVRLSLVQGDVQIDRNAGDGWEQAINNMPVIAGARIYAAEKAKAELEFEDGSSVRLAGPAQITMLALSAKDDGSKINQIQVDSGQVYVNARLRHHDDFRVLARTGEVFIITKPSRLRFTVDEQTASLAMLSGEVSVSEGPREAKVRSGETYNYVLGQPESAAREETVPPQPADNWNQQRDDYEAQQAQAGAQYSGDETYSPGTADLGYYGQYNDIPGYGMAWQPYGAGLDWNPYTYGAWSYYPSWGWTFVSAYPWGWAPFYYGNWCYINGRGWWWLPGHLRPGHGGGWHPRPRFVGAPSNWNPPHPPTHGGRGTVAVAGSHVIVGPITTTHSVPGQHGFVDATHGTVVSRPIVAPRTGSAGVNTGASAGTRVGVSTGTPATRGTSALNPGMLHGNNTPISGQRGSFSMTGNGAPVEVHRPPSTGVTVQRPAVAPPAVAPATPRVAGPPPAVAPVTPRVAGPPPVSVTPHVAPAPVVAPHFSSAPVSHSSMSAPSAPAAPAGGGGFHGGGGFSGHAGGGGHR